MQFTHLRTEKEVREHIAFLTTKGENVAIDTETSGLDFFADKLVSIQLSGRTHDAAVYFSGEHVGCLQALRTPVLILHNFKFDWRFCRRYGVDLHDCGLIRDTMLLHHLLEEDGSHALEGLVQERYHDNYKEAFWRAHKNFSEATEDAQVEYACKDVIYTKRLYEDLLRDLVSAGIPTTLIDHVHNLAFPFARTEAEGLNIDLDYLTSLATELKPKIAEFQEQLRGMCEPQCEAVELDAWAEATQKLYKPRGKAWTTLPKPQFNFTSPKQLGMLLYDKLRLPEQRTKSKSTKQWSRSVDDDSLEKLQFLHPVVPMVRDLRTYEKVYGSFIEGALERMHDAKIYPEFNINGTVTGRISSSNPNMQQLPSSGDWARVRGVYVPDGGSRFVTCDYGQLEVVVAAHYSQDANLLKIIREGASKHDITAAGIGIPRGMAKTLNFAMQYQCSPRKVEQIAGCSPSDAQRIWDRYWEVYAGEKRVVDECKRKVDAGTPIINAFGRQRHFAKSFEKPWHREAAYRQAYSSLIQGTGADLCHWAFYTTDQRLRERGLGRSIFEIHDEIVISAFENACQEAANVLQYTMVEAASVVNLTVPLTVDCSEPLVRWEK